MGRILAAAGLFGALVQVACAGDPDPNDDAGAQNMTDAGTAPDAPTIQVSPSNGAKGVKVDAPIVLTFSEPMNAASVEAAWSSTSLPAQDLAFSWNAENTILTIDASSVLQYPEGGIDVDTFDYDFTIDASANDAEGDALEGPFTSSFATARDITMVLDTVFGGTGTFDGTSKLVPVRVGDTVDNGTHRGFLTFDLSVLPANIVELTEVTLFARQDSVGGTPYQDLGTVQLSQIAPTTELDITAHTAAPRSELGVFSDADTTGDPDGDRTANVLAEVAADLSDGASVSTFRLEFTTAQDLGNDEDYVAFQEPRIDVRLLAQ